MKANIPDKINIEELHNGPVIQTADDAKEMA